MFGRKKEIPIYIFTGFLESGKTSFVRETLREDQFKDGLKTSYIICEEGVEELSKEELEDNKFVPHTIEEEDDIEIGIFLAIDKQDKPDRVIIEYNGTWDPDTLYEALPDHWAVAESIATIDASTYEAYLANMKQMMTRQFAYSDLVVFNRCRDDYDLPVFKRTVRALNKRAQVLFEMEDGTINNNVKEELPYDINAKEIEVADDDYGIWYVDTFDNVDSYVGKTVKFKAVVHKGSGERKDVFVPGRYAMTCCAEDIQLVGFPCKWEDAAKLTEKEYVYVSAEIGKAMNRQYGQEMPVLYAKKIEKTEPPADEVVYFM